MELNSADRSISSLVPRKVNGIAAQQHISGIADHVQQGDQVVCDSAGRDGLLGPTGMLVMIVAWLVGRWDCGTTVM